MNIISFKCRRELLRLGAALLLGISVPFMAFHAAAADDGDGEDAPSAVAAEHYVYLQFTGSSSWDAPKVWAWNSSGNCVTADSWPGDAMTAVDGEDNLFYWVVPADNIPTQIIFNDGASETGNKTGDLTYVDKKRYVINSASTGTQSSENVTVPGDADSEETAPLLPVTPVDPETPENPDPSGKNHIYVSLDSSIDWSKVYVWAWNSGANCTNSGNWPGDEMTHTSSGLYYWEVPASKSVPTHLIFSNGDGSQTNKSGTDDPNFQSGFTYVVAKNNDGAFVISNEAEVEPGSEPVTGEGVLGAISEWVTTDHGALFTCANGTLELTLYGPGVVKVLSLGTDDHRTERRSVTVAAEPWSRFALAEEDDDEVTLATGQVRITVNKANSLVSFFQPAATKPCFAEVTGMSNAAGAVTGTFSAPSTGAFYGGGYSSRFNMANQSLVMNNLQTGGWPIWSNSLLHNICLPYVTADNGFGVLFDNQYLNSSLSPGKSFSYASASPDPVAYYYVGGGNSLEVLRNYTALTGRQELPPYWALGYITSRYGYKSFAEADAAISGIKSIDIPVDGLVFDIQWQNGQTSYPSNQSAYGMGNLNWMNAANFPSPADKMEEYDMAGVHTILITEPFFNKDLANTAEMTALGYCADSNVTGMDWIGGGALLDASNPEALTWMWQFYKARTQEGVSGWWLDLGEPERHDNDGDTHHAGGTYEQVHNEFGQLWLQGVHEHWKEDFPDSRPFFMPRSAAAGMQRYAAFPWTGDIYADWYGLEVQIPSLLNMSMAGIAYLGSDVGGFAGTSTINPDLYRRWVGFAAFSPMLRTHTDNANYGRYAEPCYYATETHADVRALINMRYSYLPYNYTMCYEYTTKGTPMARPMSFFGDKDRLSDCSAYLWGSSLLVAPVVNSSNSVTVNFPGGEGMDDVKWVDITDEEHPGAVYQAGQSVTLSDVPYGRVPHFALMGTVIPRYMQDIFTNTSDIDHNTITFDVYSELNAGDRAWGFIYEDDMTSTDNIENEHYNFLAVNLFSNTGQIELSVDRGVMGYEWTEQERTLIFHFPLKKDEPYYDVKVTRPEAQYSALRAVEKQFTTYDNAAAFAAASEGQYLDADKGLYIKTTMDKNATGLTLNTVGENGEMTGLADAAVHNTSLNVLPLEGAIEAAFTARGGEQGVLTVHDVYGCEVASRTFAAAAGGNRLRMPLEAGVYVVTLDLGHTAKTAKVIVQ